MLERNALVCLVLAVFSVQLVVAIELIEMNDANKNEMNLALSKAMAGVQEAYQREFKFERVKDIRKFLAQCEYVDEVMARSADSDYKGLAQKIKAIMADPSVAGPCSVGHALTANFEELDTDLKAAKYD
jgi:hypothetical protein